jgi:hypothetical protein
MYSVSLTTIKPLAPESVDTRHAGRGALLSQWVDACRKASLTRATFHDGARKIIRPYTITFTTIDDSVKLSDAGFTRAKLKALTRYYLHPESQKAAIALWSKRRDKAKYGSVGLTTYAHFVKGDVGGHTPHGSAFGPCLQDVCITWIAKDRYAIDVSYRTTELFKKFAPDLVFINDVLLKPFDFSEMQLDEARFNFANVTCHSMYWCTLIPHFEDPIAELEKIKRVDPYFHKCIVRWTAMYLVPKYFKGIAKFSQALRVQKDVLERVEPGEQVRLRKYLMANHPKREEVDDET